MHKQKTSGAHETTRINKTKQKRQAAINQGGGIHRQVTDRQANRPSHQHPWELSWEELIGEKQKFTFNLILHNQFEVGCEGCSSPGHINLTLSTTKN